MTRRVLITGSRAWTNWFLIHNVLTSFHWMLAGDNHITLVSGACPKGADMLCETTAGNLGWEIERHPADWKTHGKAAGFKRNDEMVALGADVCLAFILDDSKGASYTADAAEKAGIETLRFVRYSSDGFSTAFPGEERAPESGDPDILRAVEGIERSDRVSEGAGN